MQCHFGHLSEIMPYLSPTVKKILTASIKEKQNIALLNKRSTRMSKAGFIVG